MPSKIVERILAQTGMPRLFAALAQELPPSDLQSLLLSVYQARVQGIRESGLLARAERSALLAPSAIDARVLHAFDRVAFAAADSFEAVDLSPVSPLGTNSVLGGIDQNNLLTAIRNAEVLGDSTPSLALECARRARTAAIAAPRRPSVSRAATASFDYSPSTFPVSRPISASSAWSRPAGTAARTFSNRGISPSTSGSTWSCSAV